ncbi:hypothetical protein EVAR_35348_1 [Eumeta japonica]|uniref:Uncharacterized protein n=1 Tax=Eumeta variegata TaxID=151549 RepID=A0A4C1XJ55_EUMVA|nr:hypothetical protein EVAR_35348_1 [Eumeta japonica]
MGYQFVCQIQRQGSASELVAHHLLGYEGRHLATRLLPPAEALPVIGACGKKSPLNWTNSNWTSTLCLRPEGDRTPEHASCALDLCNKRVHHRAYRFAWALTVPNPDHLREASMRPRPPGVLCYFKRRDRRKYPQQSFDGWRSTTEGFMRNFLHRTEKLWDCL